MSLSKALKLAGETGFYVFPVSASKKPFTKNGFLDASNDPEEIKNLWAGRPDALVAVAVGMSGLVVLDIDYKERDGVLIDGFDSLDKAWLDIPESFAYDSTNGKGRHVVYAAPKGLVLNGVAGYRKMPGVDRRAGGSYVVWASDSWPTEPLTPAPEWLCDEATLRTLHSFDGDLRDWYERLTPGKPNYLVRRALERVPQDMSHSDMVSAQHEAVRLGAEGNPGVPELLEALEEAFLNRDAERHVTPVEDWAYKFTEALASGVAKYGALTERVVNLPEYSLALVPNSVKDSEVAGEPLSKPSFNRLLNTLCREQTNLDVVASILWNAPATKDMAREWGIEFLYQRIEEAQESPQPEQENPSLAESRKVEVRATELLTADERRILPYCPTFEDEYFEFARADGFANEKYTRAGAWAVVSMAFAFRAFIPETTTHKMGLNLWTMVMGESGTGKSTSIMFRDQVLDEMFLEETEDATGYNLGADSSIAGLHEALLNRDREASFFGTDEASGFFKALARDGGWQTGTDDTLSRWYDGKVDPSNKVRLKDLRGKSSMTSLTVQMYATPDRLLDALHRDQFLSGFLARFQWVVGDPPVEDDSRFQLQQQEEHDVVDFDETPESVREIATHLTHMSLRNGAKIAPVIAEKEALTRMSTAYKTMFKNAQGRSNWDIIEPSITRLRQAMRKVAALNMLSRGGEKISMPDALAAINTVEGWYENLFIVADQISQGDFQKHVQEMDAWIRQKGGVVTKPQVLSRFKNSIERDPRELDVRLTFMLESGMLIRVDNDGRVEYRINE